MDGAHRRWRVGNHVRLATRQGGVPWQIVPEILPRLLADPDPTVSGRVFAAMTEMVKLDIAALERAVAG